MRALRYILFALVFLLAIGVPVLSIVLALQSAQPPVQVGRSGEKVGDVVPGHGKNFLVPSRSTPHN